MHVGKPVRRGLRVLTNAALMIVGFLATAQLPPTSQEREPAMSGTSFFAGFQHGDVPWFTIHWRKYDVIAQCECHRAQSAAQSFATANSFQWCDFRAPSKLITPPNQMRIIGQPLHIKISGHPLSAEIAEVAGRRQTNDTDRPTEICVVLAAW